MDKQVKCKLSAPSVFAAKSVGTCLVLRIIAVPGPWVWDYPVPGLVPFLSARLSCP